MLDSFLSPPSDPRFIGQSEPGPHIRPRLPDTPEVAHVFLEPLVAKGSFACLDPFLVQVEGFFMVLGVFSKEDESIGAVRADGQGFVRKSDSALLVWFFEGPVHQRLRLVER
jgi:hypothetical protein